jgi:hypothetical protein
MPEKTCFVVQGFGPKTDFTTGRTLNLDASYQVIKEAVEDAGLRCVRADEVMNVRTGSIDRPMYESLMTADVVIADLSTYNVNAAYELGVRYGVAPRSTIIVAEDQFKNPFDVGHIVIHTYRHLGEDVGRAEALRFKKALADVIRTVVAEQKTDSPIYDLFDLWPPARRVQSMAPAAAPAAVVLESAVAAAATPSSTDGSAKALLDRAKRAMAQGKFFVAQELLTEIHEAFPGDEYVVQQLALATYKGKQPDPQTALDQARQILLDHLQPETTNNPETIGLWGAVHKRLWDATSARAHLDTSIAAYERGFYLKQDYYNGINLAYLLNVRAALYAPGEFAEAIADAVLARRVRREVIRLCELALPHAQTCDESYWITATLWEAAVGLDDEAAAGKWKQEAQAAAARWQQEVPGRSSDNWMLESTTTQLAALGKLLEASPLKQVPLK